MVYPLLVVDDRVAGMGHPLHPLLVELHVVTVVSVISSGLRHRSSFVRHLHVEVWAWIVLGQNLGTWD